MFYLHRLVRRMRGAGFTALVLGLGFLGCATAEIRSELPWVPSWVTPANTALLGLALIVIGGTSIAVSFSVSALQWISEFWVRSFWRFSPVLRDYALLEMKLADMPDIYPVYQAIFGADLIPQATVEEWMRKNPRISWKIVRVIQKQGETRRELVGFFELLPLTKSGEAKLRKDEPNTASLTKDDIHSALRWASTRAYYVGSIGVIDAAQIKRPRRRLADRAKHEGIVAKMLLETLLKLGARGRIEIYGRPVTTDGLRLAREYGLTQHQEHLEPKMAVWRREINNNAKIERHRTHE